MNGSVPKDLPLLLARFASRLEEKLVGILPFRLELERRTVYYL